MKKTILFIAILMVSFVFAVEDKLDFQGIYRNTTTGNFYNGTYTFNVTFYNHSNSDAVVFSEQVSIAVKNGTWNFVVGDTVTLVEQLFYSDLLYQLKIGSTSFGKANFTKAPYAFKADYTDDSARLGGQLPSYYLNTGSKVGNTTDEIFGVCNNETFYNKDDKVGNTTNEIYGVCNNNTFYSKSDKVGNTTTEIRNQFSGGSNISFINGIVSLNISCEDITGSAGLCDGDDATGAGGSFDLNLTDGSTEIVITDSEDLTFTPAGPLSIAASGNTVTFTANAHTNRSDTDITDLCYNTAAEVYSATPHTNRTDTDITGLCYNTASEVYTATPHTNRTDTDITDLCYNTAAEVYAATPHTNLTESDVESHIFDNDNTANFNMTSYNITTDIDCRMGHNGTCMFTQCGSTYLYVCP